MSPVFVMVSASDEVLARIRTEPPLVARLIEPDDPELWSSLFALHHGDRAAPPAVPQLTLRAGEGRACDLDMTADALHWMLSSLRPGAPWNSLGDGGKPLRLEWPGGFRVLDATLVKDFHDALSGMDRELVRGRFDAHALLGAGICAGRWPELTPDEACVHVMSYYDALRDFIEGCVALELGLVAYRV